MSIFRALKLPVGLAPMAGVNNAEMAAKACNAGILGSVGCGMMSASEIRTTIDEIRVRAPSKPFHINLFIVDEDPTVKNAQSTISWVSDYCNTNGYPELCADLGDLVRPPYCPSFASQLEAVLDRKPPIVSFTFGLLSEENFRRCKEKNIQVWGTATTISEAEQWLELGVDAVILQGAEAGGHRGSFTTESEPSAVPLNTLVSEAVRRGWDNFLVAGGVMHGSDVAKYISMGASGVQVGTLFMGATDAPIPSILRRGLAGELGTETVLTRAFSGHWARSIRNDFCDSALQRPILPYPVQSKLTKPIRAAAISNQDPQSTFLWAGSRFAKCRNLTIESIVESLIIEYEDSR